jgi:outer membrane immunogenic protein
MGYEWGRSPSTADGTIVGVAVIPFSVVNPTLDDTGVVGGGHVGYNYQINQFVIGVEGDVNGSSYSGSGVDGTGLYALRERIPVDASIRGRVGVAFDRVLIYATGGAAFGSIHTSITQLFGAGLLEESHTAGRVGWTAGAGIEYAIDNNWSVRAEYRYTDYGHYNVVFDPPVVPTTTTAHLHETDNRAQIGFSYKFGEPPPPPPLVTKY